MNVLTVTTYLYRPATDGWEVLLLRRNAERGPNRWVAAGGKVEEPESPRTAAVREVLEETGLDVELTLVPLDGSYGFERDGHYFAEEPFAAEAPPAWEPCLDQREHDAHGWYSLADAEALIAWPENRPAVRALAQQLGEAAIVPLASLGEETAAWTLGGKAANTQRLSAAGFPVPRTFVVLDSTFQLLLERSRLVPEIAAALSAVPGTERSEELLRDVQGRILELELPARFAVELAALFAEGDAFIVRSSAANEDGQDASLAGQLRSFVTCTPEDAARAVIRCWASLFDPSLVTYVARTGGNATLRPHMSVLVQEWIDPRVSGVSFTNEAGDAVVSEASFGHGELLVHGLVSPDRYVLDGGRLRSAAGEKLLLALRANTTDLFPGDLVGARLVDEAPVETVVVDVDHEASTVYAEVPNSFTRVLCLSEAEAHDVSELVLAAHHALGGAIDVEWVIDHRRRLTLVQARPCTRSLAFEQLTTPAADVSASITIASPGICEGPVFVARNAAEALEAPPGSILVTPVTTPDYMPALFRVGGVVAEQGGLLSHTAIVCRELGLPCLVGYEGATTTFTTGTTVVLDAKAGAVRVLEPEVVG